MDDGYELTDKFDFTTEQLKMFISLAQKFIDTKTIK